MPRQHVHLYCVRRPGSDRLIVSSLSAFQFSATHDSQLLNLYDNVTKIITI